ncbi:MAG: hypothetical protein K2X93_22750 [Candidatus Obscuribacterales bacterium]|nr:hypothetical protein [Candidatus Obscuribacterales bacterium]
MRKVRSPRDDLTIILDKLRSYLFKTTFTSDEDRIAQAKRYSSCCHQVKQPTVSNTLGTFAKRKHLCLVAYVRSGHESSATEQEQEIIKYCKDHNHDIVAVFGKEMDKAAALQSALRSMHDADGLITVDMMRLICHVQDPVRDLKNRINNDFFHADKRLITIREGIDTGTIDGQAQVMAFVNRIMDDARKPSEGLHTAEANRLVDDGTIYGHTTSEERMTV